MPQLKQHPRHRMLAVAMGRVIRLARRQREWTQGDLARRLEVLTQNVSHWEHGRRLPSSTALLRLSDVFELPISRLFAAAEAAMRKTPEE